LKAPREIVRVSSAPNASTHLSANVILPCGGVSRYSSVIEWIGSEEFAVSEAVEIYQDLVRPQPKQNQTERWLQLHNNRTIELREMVPTPKLLFYGDSISEQWRDEALGSKTDNAQGQGRHVFHKAFVEPYGPAAVMAVSGDLAQNLLWRLQNGELPPQRPRLTLLHVGINDLSRLGANCWRTWRKRLKTCERKEDSFGEGDAQKAFHAIKAIIKELLKNELFPLVITALFPTGDRWPQGSYGWTVPRVNELLQHLADRGPEDAVVVVDCAKAVLNLKTGQIDPVRMPDFLHPSLPGMQQWAACLRPTLDRLLL